MASDPTSASFDYTNGWPTHSMGWVVAYCSKRLQEGLTKSFAKAGYRVSPEQWSIVAQLWETDGLSQQSLADRFHRSKVAAFHLITKLEQQGLVTRQPNPADGRSNLVRLTPQGRTMVAKLIPIAQQNLDRALRGIPASDVQKTWSILNQIASNMTDQSDVADEERRKAKLER